MSWKNIVIAGLLCVLASPALAVPTVSAKLLGLDTAGNWVWEVSVDPDDTLFADQPDNPDRGTGGSVAIEVGVEATGRGVVSAANNVTNFPMAGNPPSYNVGNAPAGWGTDIDGDTIRDEGVRFSAGTDRVVAFLGSDFFGTLNFGGAPANGQPKAAFRVHTEGPTAASLTTTLNFLGAYTAGGAVGGTLGVVAEAGAQTGFTLGPVVGMVRPGNARLEPSIGGASFARMLTGYDTSPGAIGRRWDNGDFNGDGMTNGQDFAILLANYTVPAVPGSGVDPYWTAQGLGQILLPTTPGAGSGGGAGIAAPEPTSLILVVLGGLFAALCGRRRLG